ncbi:hypothetical protein KKH15_01305 [Patescibacteria group bacterium]|nr:hypothetical protein [Patescibacteria group bacterium]MBU1755364.1 hypothetical protein [Patescibacteria group bacterium]
MKEKTLVEKINEVVPEKFKSLPVYEAVEIRIMVTSLVEALTATRPEVMEKYTEIKNVKDEEAIAAIKAMDFGSFETPTAE